MWYGTDVPSRDAQWVIGVIVAAVIALSTQIVGLHRRIDDVRNEVVGVRNEVAPLRSDVDEDMDGLDARLRAVEVVFGKVDQRLATIERVVLPAPDGD